MLLLHLQASLQGPGSCPAGTAACAPLSLVVFPGRSSSWVVPGRPIVLWGHFVLLTAPHILCPAPALVGAAILGLSRGISACFNTKVPRDLWFLSRDLRVELTVTLRSISEWRPLSNGPLRRGEREVVNVVVGKIWEHRGLGGGCKGRCGRTWKIRKTRNCKWVNFSAFWMTRCLSWGLFLHARLAHLFFTVDGSVWCLWAAFHTDFLFFCYDALVL